MTRDALIDDADLAAARPRGVEFDRTEPRATGARYDPASGRVIVDLTNGCVFAFPARALQGLAEASDRDLAAVEVTAAGRGLHWEPLDADVTVPVPADGPLRHASLDGPRTGPPRRLCALGRQGPSRP